MASVGWKLLSKKYTGARTKLKLTCCAGHNVRMALSSIREGNKCYYCGLKDRAIAVTKYPYDRVKEIVLEAGCTLLTECDEFKNCDSSLRVICGKCNSEIKTTIRKIIAGDWCKICIEI